MATYQYYETDSTICITLNSEPMYRFKDKVDMFAIMEILSKPVTPFRTSRLVSLMLSDVQKIDAMKQELISLYPALSLDTNGKLQVGSITIPDNLYKSIIKLHSSGRSINPVIEFTRNIPNTVIYDSLSNLKNITLTPDGNMLLCRTIGNGDSLDDNMIGTKSSAISMLSEPFESINNSTFIMKFNSNNIIASGIGTLSVSISVSEAEYITIVNNKQYQKIFNQPVYVDDLYDDEILYTPTKE